MDLIVDDVFLNVVSDKVNVLFNCVRYKLNLNWCFIYIVLNVLRYLK